MARSLRTDRTHTIGIIVDDIVTPFSPLIVRGVQDVLTCHEYLGLVVNTDRSQALEQDAIASLISRPVDGFVFVESVYRKATDELERSGKPYVFVHRLFDSSIQNSVVPDDYNNAALAVRHLLGLGHRRIAHIRGPEGWHPAERRLAAYLDEMAAAGLHPDPAYVQLSTWEAPSGYEACRQLLALPERPTAVFAANDWIALGAIYAIQDAGLRVPQDVAVVGYDNQEFTRRVRPPITTVSLPAYRMGVRAAEILWEKLEGAQGDVDEEKVPGQLYVRSSCGGNPNPARWSSTSPTADAFPHDPFVPRCQEDG